MSERCDQFVKEWVSLNVHNVPGLDDQNPEVARLCEMMLSDASELGIGGAELSETVGNLHDFLEEAYLNVHDPELGFK